MPSFGEKLKQEREKRNMTLEQISVSTKIGTRMLQALEEDKFNQLPGGIFNKGFVRAYSRCVGLDEDQAVADYLQASGDAPAVSPEIPSHEEAVHETPRRISRLEASKQKETSFDDEKPARQLPWGLFAAALLVIALALSFWNHRRQESARQPVRPNNTAATPSAIHPAPPPAAENSAATPKSEAPSASGSATPPEAQSKEQSKTPNRDQPASSTAEPSSPTQTASSASSSPASGQFQVTLQAHDESWISTAIDGEDASHETLSAGSHRTFRGQKEIILKLGNAGGVDVRFNGNKINTGGEPGEVKTLAFGPRGLEPISPSPPSQP